MIGAAWLLQQLVPPALLTYFAACWRICTFEIGPKYIGRRLGYPFLGVAYSTFATISITPIVALFLRLYFLPRNQSVPPYDPPADIINRSVIYECLSPLEEAAVRASQGDSDSSLLSATGMVNRCYKGRCAGRWKPPRARHCSTCGTCRAGFDHHCAIFANCLTAPHLPTFLCMLVLAPPTISLLSAPLLLPLARRAGLAWSIACEDPAVRGWWDWKLSWVIAGGPVGRWVGGLVLGWKILDQADGGGAVRLKVFILVAVGGLISGMCMALAATTIQLVRAGQLTIDRERARSHARASHAVASLRKQGKVVPEPMKEEVARWTEQRWFSVPTPDGGARVVPTLPDERAYELGEGNWEAVMGRGWGWLLPWEALRRGMGMREICVWELNPEVEMRLRRVAESDTT